MKAVSEMTHSVGKAVREAFAHADVRNYIPTKHAIDRARLRFGIKDDEARTWLNDIMSKASFEAVSDNGQTRYCYEGMTIIADDDTGTIITIYANGEIDFLKPVLEREKRKLKRKYTPNIRSLELQYAETLREIADMAINRAKARNPNTRNLIEERMEDMQRKASDFITKIERADDEWKSKERVVEVISE